MLSKVSRSALWLSLVAILLAVAAPVLAADGKGELSFSASLFNPNDGGSSWTARAEYLIPAGDYVYFGPSGELSDGPGYNAGAVGGAFEVHLGKTCGPGFGAAAYKPTGDAADATNLLYEARALFECGSQNAALKLTARQVWSKDSAGATTDPDGTQFDAGVVWRF